MVWSWANCKTISLSITVTCSAISSALELAYIDKSTPVTHLLPAALSRAMAESQSSEPNNPLSFLSKFQLKIPFFNQEKGAEEPKRAAAAAGDGESGIQKPIVVRFPNNHPIVPPPIEVEAEEGSGRTHNPVIIWQVYALGGFIILKWAWARWNERKDRAKKSSSSDDNQSPDEFHTPTGGEE